MRFDEKKGKNEKKQKVLNKPVKILTATGRVSEKNKQEVDPAG